MMTESQPWKQVADTITMSTEITRIARITEIWHLLIIKGTVNGSEVLNSNKEELRHHQAILHLPLFLRIPRMSGVILNPPCPALLTGAHPLSISLRCLKTHSSNKF